MTGIFKQGFRRHFHFCHGNGPRVHGREQRNSANARLSGKQRLQGFLRIVSNGTDNSDPGYINPF